MQSFTKDLILTALIIFIFIFRKQVKPFLSPLASGAVLFIAVIFSFVLQGYVMRHLPIADCLPYKIGKNMQEQMKIPAGAVTDSSVITFVYTNQGKQVEFTSDKFPADFNDSLYHFVKRYDKLVREGNAQPPIKDFVLVGAGGTDSTQAILNQKGPILFLFVKDSMNPDYKRPGNKQLTLILDYAKAHSIPFYLITNAQQVIGEFSAATKESATVLMCDAVAIKTASRSVRTLYLLQDGVIKNKWALADFEQAYGEISGK